MLRRAYFDRYGSREIIRVNNRKPEQKGRNRNLWHHVSLFFVVVGFLCTNMHQPASVLQTDWVPSSKFNHQFFIIQHYRRRHQKNGARNRWRAAPFSAARRMACQLAVEFLQWFHVLEKTIRKTCMLSCWGNIVCDICFRFSSVALLSWLVGQIMMLPYHYRHNWQLVPPVFVLNGIFWNAWMLEKMKTKTLFRHNGAKYDA